MPDWLINLLQKEGQIDQPGKPAHLPRSSSAASSSDTVSGVIPVLEQLLQQSTTTKYAYLCHPCVHHVSRLKREGNPYYTSSPDVKAKHIS